MRLAVLILITFFLTAVAAGAQTEGQGEEPAAAESKSLLYQWRDENGVVHITDGLDKVPRRFRGSARRLESQRGEEPAGSAAQPAPPVKGPSGEGEAAERAAWQDRMRAAKKRLTESQERYRQLDQRRNELLMSWGGPASGRTAGRAEAERIADEMKEVQKEIDDARNQAEVVIPEEARRAGVPPGWLRE